jgi:hypothetical protein
MAGDDALFVALAMLERPHTVKVAQGSRLRPGITLLLEIAAGDAQAMARAEALTKRPAETLQKAAGFFIEQVLLHPGCDSYRILGCNRGAASAELRRNMALIMRWLHPDLATGEGADHQMHRSIFANRITQAWETIKTEERRHSYDASLAAKERTKPRRASAVPAPGHEQTATRAHAAPSQRRKKRLVIKRVEQDSFWSRLRQLLGGGR